MNKKKLAILESSNYVEVWADTISVLCHTNNDMQSISHGKKGYGLRNQRQTYVTLGADIDGIQNLVWFRPKLPYK